MKRRIFKVRIHRKDGSFEDYVLGARDDVEARSKALALDKKSWDRAGGVKKEQLVDFCEIKFETEVYC